MQDRFNNPYTRSELGPNLRYLYILYAFIKSVDDDLIYLRYTSVVAKLTALVTFPAVIASVI
jgi:hypothetical protein